MQIGGFFLCGILGVLNQPDAGKEEDQANHAKYDQLPGLCIMLSKAITCIDQADNSQNSQDGSKSSFYVHNIDFL